MATSTVYVSYGTSQALTCTMANLATGAARTSDAQDNSGSALRALDALLSVKLAINSGADTGNDNAVYVYLYGTEDDTNFTHNATGVDAAYTLATSTEAGNLIGPYVIDFPTATNHAIHVGGPWSVANAFGGNLPRKWGIIVWNRTNGSLSTSTVVTVSYTLINNVAQ